MRHGIATEPDSGNRQLQEKAGGIDPDGLFSLRTVRISVVARTQRITPTRTALRHDCDRAVAMIASAPASADARQVRRHRQRPVSRLLAAAGRRQPATARSMWAHMSGCTPAW